MTLTQYLEFVTLATAITWVAILWSTRHDGQIKTPR